MARSFQRLVIKVLVTNKPALFSLRLYGRWMNRQPAKVLLPFEPTGPVNLKKEKVIDLGGDILYKSNIKSEESSTKTETSSSTFSPEKIKEIRNKREEKIRQRKFYLNQQKVFNEQGEVIYEKLKDNDSRLSSLFIKLKSKKERSKSGLTLVEGWRMIVDGLEANCSLKYVIFTQVEDLSKLKPFLPKTGVMFYKIPYKEIQLWSNVDTAPGIFGIFEIPSFENIKRQFKPLPLHIVCDNIRVPGNLGAILRAAVGVGCGKIYLTKGCVDVWDPKVIRSAAGAHFRLPVQHSIDWEELPKLIEPESSIFIADSNGKVLLEKENSQTVEDDLNMPILPYYGVEYASLKHITLIIGGETEGISENSYRFAATRNGLRLNIPLDNGTDSLNTAMATAVIAFEIKKQIIQAWAKVRMERKMGLST